MGTLERYLLRRFLVFLGASLLLLSMAVLVAEMLLNLDEIVEASGAGAGAIVYLLLKLPADYMWALIPISSFIGAFAALGTMARSMELTAAKAAGASPLRLCVPVLLAGLAISLLGFVTTETLGVEATSTWQRLYRDQSERISFSRGSFWYHSGDLVYNVRRANPDSRTLDDVQIFQLDDRGRLVQSIQAREARIESNRVWRLRDTAVRRFDPDAPLEPPRFERTPERLFELAEPGDTALLDANPSALSLPDLREYLSEQSFEGAHVTRLRAHMYQRMADPFVAFLFALMALPLGMRVEETRSLALPAVLGVGVVAAFWVTRSVAATLAGEGALPAPLVPWLVLAIFGAAGAVALARTPR